MCMAYVRYTHRKVSVPECVDMLTSQARSFEESVIECGKNLIACSIGSKNMRSTVSENLGQHLQISIQENFELLKKNKKSGWWTLNLEDALESLEVQQPSVEDIGLLLHRCRKARNKTYALSLHEYIQKHKMEDDMLLGNQMVVLLVDVVCMKDAQQLFDRLQCRNERSWNSLIVGYTKCGDPRKAVSLYDEMQRDNHLHLNIDTLVALLKACAYLKDLERGKKMHKKAQEMDVERTLFVGSTLVDMYAKCGVLLKAQTIFDKLQVRNVVSWTALIAGYAEHRQGREALKRFELMKFGGVLPNAVTYVCALKACGSVQDTEKGLELHTEIERQGLLERNLFVGSALVDMYVKCSSLINAQNSFDKLPIRNVVSWNALITGYSDNGQSEKVLKCFEQMQLEGIHPDGFTFACILKACGHIGDLKTGQQVHADIKRWTTLQKDPCVGNALISMYAKCGLLTKAREVFNERQVQDVVTWTALIDGYSEQGHGEEALKCFEDMQLNSISPNVVTYICCLKACSTIGATYKGEEIHAEIERRGLLDGNLIASTLIDMYAKCGSLAKAQQVFDKLGERNVVAWTSLMTGYVQVGKYENVFDIFDKMLSEGVKPSLITFVVVLHACSQTGLVSKSQTYFEAMSKEHGIAPVIEHHTCIIDLLGRAGELATAVTLIKKTKAYADLALWHTLLGACKSCGNLEIAKQAFKHATYAYTKKVL